MIRIPLTVRENAGIERCLEPVQTGIPFPKGEINSTSKLIIRRESGEVVPFDVSVMDTWSDDSLRWILCQMQINVPANGKEVVILEESDSVPEALDGTELRVEQSEKEFSVRTGGAHFIVDRNKFLPFREISVNGTVFNPGETSGMVLIDEKGVAWRTEIEFSRIEQITRLHATLLMEGTFKEGSRRHPLRFFARCFFYAGKRFAKVDFTLWNPRAAEHHGGLWDLGDRGSVFFRELSFELSTAFQPPVRIRYKTEPDGPVTEASETQIYQDSSGGKNWRSRNHVNYRGVIPVAFRGYRVSQGDKICSEGLRASPNLALEDGKQSIHAALRYFWQNFPSAIEAHGSSLRISLFPKQFNDLFELQGGERKSHTFYLEFQHESFPCPFLDWIHAPLVAHAAPSWYAGSGAFPYLVPEEDMPQAWPWAEVRGLKNSVVKEGTSFLERREIIDEYGWRNFGDQYADHENLLFKGNGPIVSHYNNQYDLLNSFLMQHAATGEDDWFRLGEELALHVMDIDIYHTEQDRYRYNGGLFWHTDHFCDAHTSTHRGFSKFTKEEKSLADYGGGPSYAHVYGQGLLHFYFLTGEPRAREALMKLASFVCSGLEGPASRPAILKEIAKNSLKWIRSTLRPSHIDPYDLLDGAGRASGNGLSVLVDAFVLTRKRAFLRKAEHLIRICVHPREKLERRWLDDVNMRWSYTVFLQALGKYLAIKEELDENDYMYHYAKESLLHYAAWMEQNERPFLDTPELIDFPNFATRSATDIRKSWVLLSAAMYSERRAKEAFERKAWALFERSMRDLLAEETAAWTRPLAILLQNIHLPLHRAVHPEMKVEKRFSSRPFKFRSAGYMSLGPLKENFRLLQGLFKNRGKTNATVS